ncbi:ribulokinase [Rubritalea halochordaticola]|uniref:Ribulokinase n=1 Tax=Rubritalea halochordaticola TaxID=714537 RepID=A0ABP9V021_9BACT
MSYSIGVDFGTNSCRALVLRLKDGCELGTSVFSYPSGEAGILTCPENVHVARQNPQDYLDGLVHTITEAMAQAHQADADFDKTKVIGIGIDTTGSTVIPVDGNCQPLAFDERFKDRLSAKVWLWKDHTAHKEATEITELARNLRPEYLDYCGGVYSSEWFWSKLLHLKRLDEEVFDAAASFVEHCDWLPAVITGQQDPGSIKRGVCSAGHKAMYHKKWGGLPDKEFLGRLDPKMADLRDRLFEEVHTADEAAGTLCAEWAEKLGLTERCVVSVGAFDAHMGAVGAGVREGVLTKVVGTSTCDIMVAPQDPGVIPGVCGVVDGSVLPGNFGIEAGQSAVGDLFLWLVNQLVPEKYGSDLGEKFVKLGEEIASLKPGKSGLLALDWNNGNRTILVDQQLTGLVLGQTLHTTAGELYRAYIEATAFGALKIIDRIEECGVKIDKVVCTGGLSLKNPVMMQIYADVIGRPIEVSVCEQTCAMGAAMFGGIAAGTETCGYASLEAMQDVMCQVHDKVYQPDAYSQVIYQKLYTLYSTLHDVFGTPDWQGNLGHVMKELLSIKTSS